MASRIIYLNFKIQSKMNCKAEMKRDFKFRFENEIKNYS